jgi:hypothetical protein
VKAQALRTARSHENSKPCLKKWRRESKEEKSQTELTQVVECIPSS